jgi:hypothetical protein
MTTLISINNIIVGLFCLLSLNNIKYNKTTLNLYKFKIILDLLYIFIFYKFN